MMIGIVVCIILALLGLETGDMFMAALFGGLSVLLIYLKSTKEERKQNEFDEAKRKAAEKLRARSNQRFGNSDFAKMVVANLQRLRWTELDDVNGIRVLRNELITPSRTYKYIDYGLAPLDVAGTYELADFIRSFYHGDDISVGRISDLRGGYTGSYSGYVSSNGGVSMSQDSSFRETIQGYSIRRIRPKAQPQGAKW